jgi:multidrug efflux system membrane fusion protein
VFANDGKTVADTGNVMGVDNQVDQTTGTVKVKAEFPTRISSSGPDSSSTCG